MVAACLHSTALTLLESVVTTAGGASTRIVGTGALVYHWMGHRVSPVTRNRMQAEGASSVVLNTPTSAKAVRSALLPIYVYMSILHR